MLHVKLFLKIDIKPIEINVVSFLFGMHYTPTNRTSVNSENSCEPILNCFLNRNYLCAWYFKCHKYIAENDFGNYSKSL